MATDRKRSHSELQEDGGKVFRHQRLRVEVDGHGSTCEDSNDSGDGDGGGSEPDDETAGDVTAGADAGRVPGSFSVEVAEEPQLRQVTASTAGREPRKLTRGRGARKHSASARHVVARTRRLTRGSRSAAAVDDPGTLQWSFASGRLFRNIIGGYCSFPVPALEAIASTLAPSGTTAKVQASTLPADLPLGFSMERALISHHVCRLCLSAII